jgi:hypothetical protein
MQAMEMNFNRLGLRNTKVICTTAEDALAKQLDHGCSLLYLDPARRSGEGKRVYRLTELQPDVTSLKSRLLQHAEHVVLKLAPMLDIQEGIRQLPETYRIDVLSWKGECRELLFHLRKDPGDVIDIHATELESTLPAFGFQLQEERSGRNAPVSAPGTLLFEPHAALRKSGARASICERFGLSVLHANTLLFTGHQDQPDFPGTRWNLSETLPYKPKMLRERFQAHGARMVFYNFPETPEQVMATLKLRSHSDHSLFFVRLNDGKAAVLYAQRMND